MPGNRAANQQSAVDECMRARRQKASVLTLDMRDSSSGLSVAGWEACPKSCFPVALNLALTRMPRFAILLHDHPFPHWDFLLEWGEMARTWRLLEEPRLGEISSEPIPDHRLTYLDYEGPVSGGRGRVKRFDAGEYDLVSPGEAIDELVVRLRGKTLNCTVRIRPQSARFEAIE